MSFTRSGVLVRSGTTQVGLSLLAVGYGSALASVGQVAPSAHANRVVYRHSGLSEWYANGPLGLEQGFTIPKAQGEHRTGPLTLSIALSGNARASLAAGGQNIVFDRRGKTSLRYSGLTATDARGRTLRSWLQLDGGRLLVRVDGTGARYPLRIDPLIQQGEKLTGSGEIGAGFFGWSVALSADRNTALIGGSGDNRPLGAAWVFTRFGSSWTQQGPRLIPDDASGGPAFGASVALSANGDTALIGGLQDNAYGRSNGLGAAWVFTRSGSTWTQQGAKLTANDEAGQDGGEFGTSVSLSADGNTALIGGPNDRGKPFAAPYTRGAAWVFTRENGTWTQQGAKLLGSDERGEGRFGQSVALSADGHTALIGGNRDENVTGNVGAAWVFTRSGSTWTQQGAKLTASDETGEGSFGSSVAVSPDGNTALIGGPGDNAGGAREGVGAVWVFTRSGSTWTQQGAKLTGSGEVGEGTFGWSVALSGDGNTALIGGWGDNGNVGAAWVFTRSGSTWTQQGAKLTGTGEVGGGQFGLSVALSSDGNTALIGGWDDHNGVGAAWVFSSGQQPPSVTTVQPSSGPEGGGTPVTITGTNLTGATAVHFGSTSATTFTVNSDSSITATAPAGTGTVDITVTTASGTSAISSADQFTYVFPTITPVFGERYGGGPEEFVAQVRPAAGSADVAQDTATVSWGDGAITTASLLATDPSTVTVTGEHTYWIPGRLPLIVTLTDSARGTVETFHGDAVVQSRYAGLGDSYSSGEGAGWPSGQTHPNLPGCSWQLYQDDPSGFPTNTDEIVGAQLGFVPGISPESCEEGGLTQPYHGNTCHRARTAYSHVVERLLAIEGMRLDFVACSGATVHDAYFKKSSNASQTAPREHENEQANKPLVLGRDVSLITLTLGGNDLRFPHIAEECVAHTVLGNDNFDCVKQDQELLETLGYNTSPGSPKDGEFGPPLGLYKGVQTRGFNRPLSEPELARMGSLSDLLVPIDLHDALVMLYRVLRAQAPGARILVLGYPHFFPQGGTGNECQHFSALEQPWVNERIGLFDNVIRDAALESGVAEYVDVYDALTVNGVQHEECEGQGIGGPEVEYVVDPTTLQVGPCNGVWINPIDVVAGAIGKVPLGFVGSPENLHTNPCAHQREGELVAAAYRTPSPPPIDTFALTRGESHVTEDVFPSGIDRLNLTASWAYEGVTVTLRDPGGRVWQPVEAGPTFATWDVRAPAAGRWTVTAANDNASDLGEDPVSITSGFRTLPMLPPAGEVTLEHFTCPVIGTGEAELGAAVNPKAESRVSNYEWFDDQGHRLTQTSGTKNKNRFVRVTSFISHYKVILQTDGSDGTKRYSVGEFAPC